MLEEVLSGLREYAGEPPAPLMLFARDHGFGRNHRFGRNHGFGRNHRSGKCGWLGRGKGHSMAGYRRLRGIHLALGAALLAMGLCGTSWSYEYDENDPSEGAGAEGAWRSVAQWDEVDEEGTREIHKHTTEARYISPMVSYIPEDDEVPSPRDVLGYIAGTEGILTRPEDTIR